MTCKIYNKNCFEFFKEYEGDHDIDCVIVDLPYGQTDNHWDTKIDLELMWKNLLRMCKRNATYIFFCTTRFGVDLINSKPNYFKYDLVWEKNNTVGHLSVKKIPLRKHEMIYIFGGSNANDVKKEFNSDLREYSKKLFENIKDTNKEVYTKCGNYGLAHFNSSKGQQFGMPSKKNYTFLITEYKIDELDFYLTYEELKKLWKSHSNLTVYNPQMTQLEKPVKVNRKFKVKNTNYGVIVQQSLKTIKKEVYPVSVLNYGYDKEKLHITQKPVPLLEWLMKTYSNEDDVILDFTMGSGSTGVACKNTKRNFIGVELDKAIFDVADKRLNG